MAKRYHQTRKGRDGEYAGYKERLAQEREDGAMLKEDRSAIANMPQNAIIREYPRPDYESYDLDDTIRGVDEQIDKDVRGGKRKSGRYPEKY